MKEWSYLNSAVQILQAYNGQEPFASFSRKHFSQHKKYGSKDRKQISHLCYCYFRLGKATLPPPLLRSARNDGGILEDLVKIEERILMGLFLCSTEANEILQQLKPVWNEKVNLSREEKCFLLSGTYPPLGDGGLTFNVFPWKEELSDGIEYENFCRSFFIQPDLFIRIRPHHAEKVLLKLEEAKVGYEFISPFTVRLPSSFKADRYFDIDKEVVIQDYSSQQVAAFMPVRPGRSDRVSVWDCCAASGGKSIMAYDLNPNVELTVSDIRESILINLKKRFASAGIKNYKSFVADLAGNKSDPDIYRDQNPKSEIVIADAPCTGSGTWSRTPDQLFYFDKNEIDRYASLQKKIVSNAISHLLAGGYFLYITCSVFKKENEEVVEFIKKNFQLNLIKMEILKGYDKKADTMFAALFRKLL